MLSDVLVTQIAFTSAFTNVHGLRLPTSTHTGNSEPV